MAKYLINPGRRDRPEEYLPEYEKPPVKRNFTKSEIRKLVSDLVKNKSIYC